MCVIKFWGKRMNSVPFNSVQEEDVPRERTLVRELLLAGHFDLAPPEAGPPEGNTTYEQLTCVSYRPQFNRLDAVVQINQSCGYSGGLCTSGSQEYVKFFASTDDGATWTDLGLTSFTIWNVPGPKPLEFGVSIPVDLAAACCTTENLVLIRAILSWQIPPGGPTDPIVWGNGLDVTVQVAPFALATLQNLLDCLGLQIEPGKVAELADLGQIVEFGPGQPLTPAQLHDLYQKTDVPPHRYLLGQVSELLASPAAVSAAAYQPGFKLVPALADVADLGALLGSITDPQGNETYEQLGCVGLNTVTDELVATVDVKQPTGYLGGLCTSGSQEYVAFWADWGGGFQYVGTGSVNVHDIASIPVGGLQYSVALSFPQALTQCQPCGDGPLTVVIRAVLSWDVPPSDTDPFAVPVWGGHLEATVLIPPGQPVTDGGPVLESIGSMPVALISDTTGLASGTSLVPAIGIANACPFGLAVEFTGHVINPATGLFGGPGMQYRILVSTNGGLTSTPMTEPFQIVLSTSPTPVTQTPDPATGWCTYWEQSGVVDVVGNILGSWMTSGNGQIWISMEAQQGGVPIGAATPWQLVQLDNTAPDPVDIEITSGTGSCGDFYPGNLIEGTYSATDNENLRLVTIGVVPGMPGATITQTVGSSTLTTQSGTWSLQTLATTEPCGYVMVVSAWDNTIVDSGYIGFLTQNFAGFCLRPAADA
jgi:hypothetical protein